MNKTVQQIMRESLYGSPTLPQSAQSTFSPAPFTDVSKPDAAQNFAVGTAEFGYNLTDDELNDAMKKIEPLLNEIGITFWSVNQTNKVINISINTENLEKAKALLRTYGFDFRDKTFGGEPRTPDMNSTPKLTAYGREAGANGGFGGGGLLNGYPVDRLAGE